MKKKQTGNASWISKDNPFEKLANRYDAWFDTPRGWKIFTAESHALRNLITKLPPPWLEVGIGTGRFAQTLGIKEGVDPSLEALKIAIQRDIRVCIGYAEDLPFRDSTYGTILMTTTICFLSDPKKALCETKRVLKKDGYLLLGLLPKNTPWEAFYAQKAQTNHSFYTAATFYTSEDIIKMVVAEGFILEKSRSCLFESPKNKVTSYSDSREGIITDSGFVSLCFKKEL